MGIPHIRMLRPVHGTFVLELLVATLACWLLAGGAPGAAGAAGASAAFLVVLPSRRSGQAARPFGMLTGGHGLLLPVHPPPSNHPLFKATTKCGVVDTEREDPNNDNSSSSSSSSVESWTRRVALMYGSGLLGWARSGEIAVASSSMTPAPVSTMAASAPPEVVVDNEETPNFNALLDLPPVTEGCVRLYLCRHGQTENNRLRKVQGARIDMPLNENGMEQAKNLGQALQRLHPAPPRTFVSSNLQRAKQTAEIASSVVVDATGEGTKIKVKFLDSLGEVDFGPVAEGRPVVLAKAGMQATYAVWATGNIDFRPEGGEGESGREVLQRASLSIAALAKAASESKEGACVAVTHSTFLRMLLAIALDVPLLEAATYSVVNGGVSVIDVPRDLKTRRLGTDSRLFSRLSMQEVLPLDLEIPVCTVVRINETRHLPTRPILV